MNDLKKCVIEQDKTSLFFFGGDKLDFRDDKLDFGGDKLDFGEDKLDFGGDKNIAQRIVFTDNQSTSSAKGDLDFIDRDSKFRSDLKQNILMTNYIKSKYRRFFDFCFNNIYIMNPKVVNKEYIEFVNHNLPEMYCFKETKIFKKLLENGQPDLWFAEQIRFESGHIYVDKSLSCLLSEKEKADDLETYYLSQDLPSVALFPNGKQDPKTQGGHKSKHGVLFASGEEDLSIELSCDTTSEEENIIFDENQRNARDITFDNSVENFSFDEIENDELEKDFFDSEYCKKDIYDELDTISDDEILQTYLLKEDGNILWSIHLHGTAMDFHDISDIFLECQRDTNILLFFYSITLEVYNDIYQQLKSQKINFKIITFEITVNPFFVLSFHYAGNSISTYRNKLLKAYSTKRLTVYNKKNYDLNFKLLNFLEDLSKHNCKLSKIHYLYSFYYLNDLILDSKKIYYKIFLGYVPKFIVNKIHYSKFEEYERKKMKYIYNYLSSKNDVFNLF